MADEWSQFNPSEPAADNKEADWSQFSPQVNYEATGTPTAFTSRLADGHAYAENSDKSGWGQTFSAIWNAAKEGFNSSANIDSQRQLWAEQAKQIGLDQNPDSTWRQMAWATATGVESYFTTLDGIIKGGAAAAGQATAMWLGENEAYQAKARRDFAGMVSMGLAAGTPELVGELRPYEPAPLVATHDGNVARLVEGPAGVEAQVVGGPVTPQLIKEAAAKIAGNKVADTTIIESKVKDLWEKYGLHPNEAVEAVQNSNVHGHDLSAAQTPPMPIPPKPTHQYISEIDNNLFKLRTASLSDKAEMWERLKSLQLDPELDEKLYRYIEGEPGITLDPKEGEIYNKFLLPLKQEEYERMDRIYTLLGKDALEYDPTYMHRAVKGETPTIDRFMGEGSEDNPILGNGIMSRTTSSMQPRTYFALQNAKTGERRLVAMTNNGRSLRSVDKGSKLEYNAPGDEPLKPGEQVVTNGGEWQLVNARTHEIEENTELRYYKSAAANTIDNVLHLRAVERAIYRAQQIRSTPEWEAYTTRSGSHVPEGWISPQMPLFKNDVMEPKLAHAIDDFWGRRDTGPIEEQIERINRLAIGSLFWTPFPHIGNAGAHWIMGRGWDNITPAGMVSLFKNGAKAIKSVVTQDKTVQRLLNNGSSLIYSGVANKNFYQKMLTHLGQEIEKQPDGWDGIAKVIGINPKELAQAYYGASSRILWSVSDMMMVQRVLELEEKGMTTAEAIAEAERHMPNYRIPSDAFGDHGIRNIYANPEVFEFSRYHYGIIKGYASVARDLVKGNTQEKIRAIGNIVALGTMQAFLWPGLSAILQNITDNKDLRVPSFGPGRLLEPVVGSLVNNTSGTIPWPQYVKDYYGDNWRNVVDALYTLIPISPAVQLGVGAITGRDYFTGRSIVEPSDKRNGNIKAAIAQGTDWTAQKLIEPYNAFVEAWREHQRYGKSIEESANTALLKNIFGLRDENPEKAAARQRAFKYQDREAKARHKKPLGPIEELGNE